MKIWVSSLASVHDTHAAANPAAAISLLSPGDAFPDLKDMAPENHHRVHMHDIRESKEDHVTPGETHVAGVIAFLEKWQPENPLLVHCWAGISRSSATAFIAACLHNPEADEAAIAQAIRDASPTAYPNTLIVAHADKIMQRDGRMIDAVKAMSEWQMAEVARPFHIPSRF